MRYTLVFLVPLLFSVFSACTNEDPQPQLQEIILPSMLEELDYKQEFIFDDKDRIEKIKITSTFPNNQQLITFQNFIYNENGKLKELINNEGWKAVYTYDNNNRITRTDEYLDESLSQYHTFTYNDKGLLSESYTWQDIPEEGGLTPIYKNTYEYDTKNNLIESQLMYYSSADEQHKLLTKFVFSDYDNKNSTDQLFNYFVLNPYLKFRLNNPGKLVISNMNGIVTSTELYIYEYNEEGFVTKRTTNTSFYNGETGSYETNFHIIKKLSSEN